MHNSISEKKFKINAFNVFDYYNLMKPFKRNPENYLKTEFGLKKILNSRNKLIGP